MVWLCGRPPVAPVTGHSKLFQADWASDHWKVCTGWSGSWPFVSMRAENRMKPFRMPLPTKRRTLEASALWSAGGSRSAVCASRSRGFPWMVVMRWRIISRTCSPWLTIFPGLAWGKQVEKIFPPGRKNRAICRSARGGCPLLGQQARLIPSAHHGLFDGRFHQRQGYVDHLPDRVAERVVVLIHSLSPPEKGPFVFQVT